MVRVCQADEGIQQQVESLLQQRLDASIGLVLGKLGSGPRDFALGLIATPHTEDGKPPVVCRGDAAATKGKKGGKGQVLVVPEEDWIVEHARQAGRMLPGGLQVVGLYFFGPEAGLQQAVSNLSKLSEECVDAAAVGGSTPDDGPGAVLLYADSNSRKIAAKICTNGSAQPAELKWMPLVDSFVPLQCTFHVDVSLPATTSTAALSKLLQRIVSAERKRVMAGEGMLLRGDVSLLPADETPLSDLQPKEGGPLCVSLLCPFPFSDGAMEELLAGTAGEAKGSASIQGTLEGRAFVYKRDTWAMAVSELKADIAATLKTRLQMMLEDAEEEGSQAPKGDDGGNGNSQGVAASPIVTASGLGLFYLKHLPRRVAFPWSGSIMLSDYLFPGDTEDDAAAHAAQLLAFSPGSVKVVEWEAPPVREAASTEPAWHPLTGCAVAQPPDREAEGGGAAFGRCSMAVMICLAGAAGLATAYVAALMEG